MASGDIKRIRNVLLIILVANVFVAILKIVIGTLIKSTSMTADGYHSLADGASNVVGLIGIWYAARPQDKNHPYGHRKFETLAGLFIGGMLALVGTNVMISAIKRLFYPLSPSITLESIIVLLVTLAVNIFISWFEYKEGKKLNSEILIADSLHTRSDIYVSMGVLVTLVCISVGLPSVIDSITSIAVAVFIFHAAYEIFNETSGILLDKAVVDAEKIRKIILEFPEVKDVHEIKSRGSQADMYVDVHIMTEPMMSVQESHMLAHNIEDKMKEELCENTQVNVHLEPYYSTEK
jgi:cation diffusion facilitator family transporter